MPSLVSLGDRVMVFNWSGGAFADEMVVSEANAFLLPSAIDFASAAALKSTYGTALYALTTRARLGRDEALLVLGAAGGIGQATLEVGKLLSSTVIAAVGSEAKVRLLKELGTEQVINYSSENLRDRVRELTTGKGADVIIDPVGGELFDQAIRAIAWSGRLCILGFASGHIAKLSINQVLLRSFDLVGVNYGGWVDNAMEAQRSQTQQLIGWCAEGKIRPNVSATMGLAQVPLAMRQMLERSTSGKIVFSPSNLSANP